MPKKAALLVGLLLLAATSVPAFANHVQDVLGDQTSASSVNFPPVASGPGYILPDSPLYVVDRVFQQFRLALAFTPERRVEIRNLILGERLAELRVMVERGNRAAMQTTLNELANESEKISSDLADAAAQGKDVKTLAKNTNDLMKLHREILKTVAEQADNAFALQVESTRQSMLMAKVRVEDQLTEDEMLEAVENDLEDEVDTQVLGVETAVKRLEDRLQKLDNMVKKDEAKLESEGDADIKDIRNEMKKLKEERKRLFQQLKNKRKLLKEERKKKMKKLRERAKQTRDSIKELREARKAEKEGNFKPTPTTTITPSPEPTTNSNL